jgi:hypothetical protein
MSYRDYAPRNPEKTSTWPYMYGVDVYGVRTHVRFRQNLAVRLEP